MSYLDGMYSLFLSFYIQDIRFCIACMFQLSPHNLLVCFVWVWERDMMFR